MESVEILGLARVPDYKPRARRRRSADCGQLRGADPVSALSRRTPATRDRRIRRLRHESWGLRHVVLELETRKFRCQDCHRSFWQRFPGILPRKRATEPFRRSVSIRHWDGISRSRMGQREGIGSATVERWFQDFLKLRAAERKSAPCPRVLGIDEHFFSRRKGFATTLRDLRHHTVYDVVLGRSEASLEDYFLSLKGKQFVQVVCMDLTAHYRSLVRKHSRRL